MADISPMGIPDFGNLINSYGQGQAQIGNTNANTALTSAQVPQVQAVTQGQQLTNEMSALKLNFIKQGMQQQANIPSPFAQSGEPDTPQEDQSGVDGIKTNLVANANRNYQPLMWTPQNAAVYAQLDARDKFNEKMGMPTALAESYKGQFDAYNGDKQTTASNDLQMWTAVAKNGYAALEQFPNAPSPAALRKAGFTDDDIKDLAAKMAPTSLAFSGKPTERNGAGDLVLTGSGQQIPGVDKMPMSLEQAEKAADAPATWYNATNQKQEGTRAQQLGIPRQSMISALMHTGQEPQPARGSPAGVAASTAAANDVNSDPKSPYLVNRVTGQAINTAGLQPKDVATIKELPTADGAQKPGAGEINANQADAYKTWLSQKTKLEADNSEATRQMQQSQLDIGRMNNLIKDIDPKNFGPGSDAWTQTQTFAHNWFGTAANSASARQILTKVVGADQIDKLLAQFHGAGAQVRLGAYETRIFMEALSANPGMTKEALQQLLTWQGSDTKYNLKELKFQSTALNAGKDPNQITSAYETANPRADNIDTQLTQLGSLSSDKLKSIPREVGNQEEYKSLESGQRYMYNGKSYVKQ